MKSALTGVGLANDEIGAGVCLGTGKNSCVSVDVYVYAGARMHKKRAVKTARFSVLRLISPRDAGAGTGSRHG